MRNRLSSGTGCEANRKTAHNGAIKAPTGTFELATRDRNGARDTSAVERSIEPYAVRRGQKRRIIRLFALGMSYGISAGKLKDLYTLNVYTIARLPYKVIPELKTVAAAPAGEFIPSSGWTPFTIKSRRMVVTRTRPSTRCWR
ncbi:hypothetical protein KCP73_01465 [Salmonella enterica subsp. enterica]|nr:hypothetical protein KCP73_01465 [Salmonella enterica subsp. enterica]